jgi:mono/diheme cytochrome c family protein
MKIVKLCLFLSAIALFIFACSDNKTATTNTSNIVVTNTNTAANTQPTAAPDELASAKKTFLDKCVRCHKEDGTGGKTEIDGVKINAPNLTSDKFKKEPDSEFIKAIEKGFPDDGMPAFKGKISDEEIKNLVKLIRKEFQKQ